MHDLYLTNGQKHKIFSLNWSSQIAQKYIQYVELISLDTVFNQQTMKSMSEQQQRNGRSWTTSD